MLCTLAAVGTSWVYLSKQTPIYSSTSRLFVQQYTKLVGENNVLENPAGASTQAELISSNPLLEDVAKRPEIREMNIMKGIDNLTPFIKSRLVVTPDREFINITFESPDPVEAAQLVNAVADAYISFTGKQRKNTAAEVLKLLQKEKEKREVELAEHRKATLDFKRSHGMLSFQDEKGNIVLQRLSKLSEALTTAEMDSLDAASNLQVVQGLRDQPDKLLDLARGDQPTAMEVNVDRGGGSHDQVDSRLLASGDLIRSEIELAERNLDRLRRTRTPLHKDVLDAEADLSMLKTQLVRNDGEISARKQKLLAEEQAFASNQKQRTSDEVFAGEKQKAQHLIDSYLLRTERRATLAKQREVQLQKSFDLQKQQAFDLNATAAEYASLESELTRTERLVNMLDDRIKDINVSEDTNMVSVNVIDVAKPGTSPVRPDKKRIMGMGLILGLMLGVGMAFGLDFLDQRIRSAEEVAALDRLTSPRFGPNHLAPGVALDARPQGAAGTDFRYFRSLSNNPYRRLLCCS